MDMPLTVILLLLFLIATGEWSGTDHSCMLLSSIVVGGYRGSCEGSGVDIFPWH